MPSSAFQIDGAWGPLLQSLTMLIAAGALVVAVWTYVRSERWRKEDNSSARLAKVEAEAVALRDKIDAEIKVLSEKLVKGDGDTRQALQRVESRITLGQTEQAKQLAALTERIVHIPTQADISVMVEAIGKLSRETGENGVRMEGLVSLVTRSDARLERLEENQLQVLSAAAR